MVDFFGSKLTFITNMEGDQTRAEEEKYMNVIVNRILLVYMCVR